MLTFIILRDKCDNSLLPFLLLTISETRTFFYIKVLFSSQSIKSLWLSFKAGNTARLLTDRANVVQYEIAIANNMTLSL